MSCNGVVDDVVSPRRLGEFVNSFLNIVAAVGMKWREKIYLKVWCQKHHFS